MVSVALEANRKHFPWVELNNFSKKMVKADCIKEEAECNMEFGGVCIKQGVG